MSEIELLHSFEREEPVLSPIAFIQHRKKLKQIHELQFPEYCLLGFFPGLYSHIRRTYKPTILDFINKKHPYYIFRYKGVPIAFLFPGIGAPLAGAMLEETIALGGNTILFFGMAGILSKDISKGEIILPCSAIRDEGTSFHYEKPAQYSYPNKEFIQSIASTLNQKNIPFRKEITWTTDGVYRETPSKIQKAKEMGSVCVDMETSALFSIASFHSRKIAGLLLTDDSIAKGIWEPRPDIHAKYCIDPVKLFEIAADCLIQMVDNN
jgi:purine-nucleoside phosphorylase